MPKIISNIEEKIFSSALELFSNYGYKDTDMKLVASRSGIAVGTLYNYHKSKKELFIYVLTNFWNMLIIELKDILDEDYLPIERTNKLIELFYDKVFSKVGLGKAIHENYHLIENSEQCQKSFNGMKDLIYAIMDKACYDYSKHVLDYELKQKGVTVIIASIISLEKNFPNEREKNLKFLFNMAKSIMYF